MGEEEDNAFIPETLFQELVYTQERDGHVFSTTHEPTFETAWKHLQDFSRWHPEHFVHHELVKEERDMSEFLVALHTVPKQYIVRLVPLTVENKDST